MTILKSAMLGLKTCWAILNITCQEYKESLFRISTSWIRLSCFAFIRLGNTHLNFTNLN